MVYIPILGAFSLAAGTLLEKLVLMRKKMNIKLYQTTVFLATMLVMFPFLYFFWSLSPGALSFKNILIFVLVIIFSITANLFTFFSMKWEKISNLEPAKILEPLFTILLAIILSFFIDSGLYERNYNVIIPAIIAGIALVFSHIKKHHLKFNKYFIAAILGSFFFALELVTSRLILDFYSPITFYFLRCASIFLISFLIFRPKFYNNLNARTSILVLLTGSMWFIYRVAVYYGYLNLGIFSTTLIVMLAPVLIYLFAHFFLKEKMYWRNIISSIVILGAVLYSLLA